ncbi:YgeY family selenium metabolism-linked hydrolase [Clostridium sp. AM58-1XD]|uniref:YgeY family selenium metabolism-linked hydrolase n=1 Tax=Clostridium sp. AM58-1XD TaxID=2292307 RepID=UPI000E514684|nr:YgeY family selenium metabolism-linked hydrolase [Clostridium sp. AM58-1XD]RGY98762.1 YgeY family selenium metabolism-linked hydrolase [Clostridium sp. AM58-1XD]
MRECSVADRVRTAAEGYSRQMERLLREVIAIPSGSCEEEGVIRRLEEEMKRLEFDEVFIDGLGNLLGYMGCGKQIIAFDGHVDTVGVGQLSNWTFDPYEGCETEDRIGGRGASDQLGGVVSAIYGARIMKDLDLIPDGVKVLVTCTVQEEDCDGLCWQYICNEDHIRPEFVVITEPTDGGIYRGQRGRMEIRVEVKGISCHGSAPERGENAIFRMADILQEIRAMGESLKDDGFLGKGTVTASEIFFTSPARCAVADSCAVSLDRRLTDGETWEMALEELRNLPSCRKYNAQVTLYPYEKPSWTGLVYPTECYFPTWVISEDHPAVEAAAKAYRTLLGEPRIDRWTFSTNAVSIMGRYKIPCVGFGPGSEKEAHAPNETMCRDGLVKCASVYALIPSAYFEEKETDDAKAQE